MAQATMVEALGLLGDELPCDRIMRVMHEVGVSPDGKVERRIVAGLILTLRSAGWVLVGASDGDYWLESSDARECMSFVFERVSNTTLRFVQEGCRRERGVFLVPGNGVDIVTDYHIAPIFSDVLDGFDPEVYA
jgi:hypothetical protein